jgi:1,4-dihydroxy-2-naphthoate polyprenyltransferase
VFVVWGPLMVGGTYYAATGSIPGHVIAASLPFALLATTVLMGKHIDKIPWDAPKGIGTLPVLVGEKAARIITLGMMVSFYVLVVVLAALRALPLPAVVAVLALPRLFAVWRVYREGRPPEPPRGYPVWPLWYAPAAFIHARRSGSLLVLGLAVSAVFRVV